MTAFKLDITNAPFTRLLLMFHDMVTDSGNFRAHLTHEWKHRPVLGPAYDELRAEIERRLPTPGAPMPTRKQRPISGAAKSDRDPFDPFVAFVRSVPAHTKHGPGGSGAEGPCDSSCLKCRAEALLVQISAPVDGPQCAAQGKCACYDGCGACEGCGRWLEDEMKPIRARVRVAVIDLLHALDDKDLGALPPDTFDRELDAIIYAAKGL
jgi:hypothetical protein